MIVDDEKQIREGLKKIVNWEDYGVDACFEAGDGLEALEVVESERPEIVITDVRMPRMDGITLLERLKEIDKNCQVIILSGYDDYTLVRKALKLGAADYLLKPVSSGDLVQIIDEVTENIENSRNGYEELNADHQLLQRSLATHRFLNGEITPIEYKNRMSVLEHEVRSGSAMVGVAVLEQPFDDGDEPSAFSLLSYLYKAFPDEDRFVCFLDDDLRPCFLFWEAEDILKGRHFKLPEKIISVLEEQAGDRPVLMLGSLAKSFRSVAKSYQDAIVCCNFLQAFSDKRILTYDEVVDAGNPEKTRAMDIDEEGFLERIKAFDTAGAVGYARSCSEAFGACESYQDLLAFKNGLAEFAVLTCQGARTAGSVDRREIISKKEQVIKRIYQLPNESEAFSCLEQFIRDTVAKMQGDAKPVYSRLVSAMLSMAGERYGDMDLSLQYLALEMKGNAAYLGRVFKNETGWSFNDYLSHIRTEKARELLRDTGMKGGEISEKVGFSNYNYFYLIFKKLTGMTPMDYRKKMQGQEV